MQSHVNELREILQLDKKINTELPANRFVIRRALV